MSSLLIDLKDGCVVGSLLVPKTVTTSGDAAGSAVDMAGGTVWGNAVLSIGAVSGTSPTLDAKLQSNTTSSGGTWTDITGAAFAQKTTSNQQETINFALPAGQKYVRMTGTTGGTSPSFAAHCLLAAQKKYVAETNAGYSRSPST